MNAIQDHLWNGVKHAFVLLAFAMIVAAPARATDDSNATKHFSVEQSRAIEQIVHDYILSHPEIIEEAINKLQEQQQKAEEARSEEAAKGVKPVVSEDHILGDPSAPVRLVEFSDFECPFCKRFHPTVKQVMEDYGKSGKVAIIYRHFPLDQLHPKARKEAQAAECANELGGNDAFWAYAGKIFEVTPSNNNLDLSLLPKLAEDIGLDRAKFETCIQGDMRGGKFADHIEANVQDATASGGTGTPYTLVIGPKGKVYPINGAVPYRVVQSIIDMALKE